MVGKNSFQLNQHQFNHLWKKMEDMFAQNVGKKWEKSPKFKSRDLDGNANKDLF